MDSDIWRKIYEYFQENLDSFLTTVAEHIMLSIASLFLATIIGVFLGYLCFKRGRYEKWIVGIFQVLRIIPSLAILFLLIPIMGTGLKPALIALVLLAVPPILMNTVGGFQDIPDFMIETASGIGMTEKQRFWKVELPLALPLMLAGIKIAMIEVIASATLAAKIGAGGLGGLIFTGLGLNRTDLLLVGGVSVAVLSITFGMLFNVADKWIFRYKKI